MRSLSILATAEDINFLTIVELLLSKGREGPRTDSTTVLAFCYEKFKRGQKTMGHCFLKAIGYCFYCSLKIFGGQVVLGGTPSVAESQLYVDDPVSC